MYCQICNQRRECYNPVIGYGDSPTDGYRESGKATRVDVNIKVCQECTNRGQTNVRQIGRVVGWEPAEQDYIGPYRDAYNSIVETLVEAGIPRDEALKKADNCKIPVIPLN